jgi:hypothetical protein
MPHSLRLHFEPDTDGTGELFAEVQQGAFAGSGSAWFGVEEVAAFGASLRDTFPIPSGVQVSLRGGFWSKTGAPTLEERHLELRVYPVGGAGAVGIRVELATPVDSGTRQESQCSVGAELLTNYEQLRTFGSSIVALVRNSGEPAVLNANDG